MGKKHILLFPFLFVFLTFIGCDSNHENAAIRNLNSVEKMHFKQYMVYGQQLYTQHCSNCHQNDGSGLEMLIPPLASSDYMLEDIGRTVCLIKFGLEGNIVVNGDSYNHNMPANTELTDLEIAQITTYILNSWDNQKGYVSVKEVTEHLKSCE